MTEAEIAQALQARLAVPVKIAVKRRQGHLHVLLSRPPETQLDYPYLTEQVRAELGALGLPGLEQVTVYGRESGHSEYEWQKTEPLPTSPLPTEETTLLFARKSDLLLQDLTVVAPEAGDPKPEVVPEEPRNESLARRDGGRLPWRWVGGAALLVGMGLVFLIFMIFIL